MSKDLLSYLVQDGLLSLQAAGKIAETAREQGVTLTDYLITTGLWQSDALLHYCAKHFDLPIFDLDKYQARWFSESGIDSNLLFQYRVLPLHRDQAYLHMSIADPTEAEHLKTLSFHTGLRFKPVLVDQIKLKRLLGLLYKENVQTELASTLNKMNDEEEAPIIEFVDHLINDAVQKNISDIHIEPFSESYRIRLRRDGFLYERSTLAKELSIRVVTRLKIMANLNIAERRLPQDGRIRFKSNNHIDIRINTCPTLYGEKIVLRILNANLSTLSVDHLGFSPLQKQIFLQHIQKPQGLILVTGPTGSGKTTTLYTALNVVNRIEKNIMSVEDPVEIELPGVNQININPRIGLDFVDVLRATLRQDPDVIMVGEIRDGVTADIAMQAAQTGHLVLSTLHTNNAVETITRLQSMGVKRHHLQSSLSLIIAERLLRKICNHCGIKEKQGCEDCHQGFKGRIGVFEFLPIESAIAQAIHKNKLARDFAAIMKSNGLTTLWESGMDKVTNGQTTLCEVKRVLSDHASIV